MVRSHPPAPAAAIVVAVFAVLAAAATAAGESPIAEANDVTAIVGRVQSRFDATADLRADVAQEVFIASLGRSELASGTVVFARPGKMRWTLTGDEPQVIVADGVNLWFYQPADEQVLKAPLESVFRSTTPVSFLMGVGRIADDFEVSLEARTSDAIDLALDPKRTGGDLGRLQLTVDPSSFDIREAKITDPVGNVTRLVFSNLRRNTGVREEQFEFEIPPGVDVVEAPIGY
jgi:outer membrane lipoprotein carrier protein